MTHSPRFAPRSSLPLDSQGWRARRVPAGNLAAGDNAPMDGAVRMPEGIAEQTATVDGVIINYKIGGQGPVVVLLHGFTQTSHMWLPLMPQLATSHP